MDADKLWREHMERPFPAGLAGQEVEGIDLVLLDTAMAGLITTVVGSRRRLAAEQASELVLLTADCSLVAVRLQGENRVYFDKLARLGRMLLETAKRFRGVGRDRHSDRG